MVSDSLSVENAGKIVTSGTFSSLIPSPPHPFTLSPPHHVSSQPSPPITAITAITAITIPPLSISVQCVGLWGGPPSWKAGKRTTRVLGLYLLIGRCFTTLDLSPSSFRLRLLLEGRADCVCLEERPPSAPLHTSHWLLPRIVLFFLDFVRAISLFFTRYKHIFSVASRRRPPPRFSAHPIPYISNHVVDLVLSQSQHSRPGHSASYLRFYRHSHLDMRSLSPIVSNNTSAGPKGLRAGSKIVSSPPSSQAGEGSSCHGSGTLGCPRGCAGRRNAVFKTISTWTRSVRL